MARFSATDAAFEGFRLTRERPKAVLAWALFLLVVIGTAVGLALATGLAGDLGGDDPRTPSELAAALTRMAPLLLLLVPVVLAAVTVLAAAIYRAVLFPEEERRAYLRLGRDELQLFLVMLLFTLVWIVFIGVVAALIGGVTSALEGGARALVLVVLVIAAICVAIWAGVRLSLVPPMAIGERAIRIREGWELTRGRFWPLFGAYLLAWIFSLLVSLLASVIGFALLGVLGGGVSALAVAENPQAADTPMLIVGLALYLLVQLASTVLQFVLQTAPAASAYGQLSGEASASPGGEPAAGALAA